MVYSARRFLALCDFVFVFFSPFSIAITSLGEERAYLIVLFVRLFDLRLFGFVCFLFVFFWKRVRLVIVALLLFFFDFIVS